MRTRPDEIRPFLSKWAYKPGQKDAHKQEDLDKKPAQSTTRELLKKILTFSRSVGDGVWFTGWEELEQEVMDLSAYACIQNKADGSRNGSCDGVDPELGMYVCYISVRKQGKGEENR
jgi:hypothetical protein